MHVCAGRELGAFGMNLHPQLLRYALFLSVINLSLIVGADFRPKYKWDCVGIF